MTQVSDFKAFLWRHPDIHGMSRTEMLLSDIRSKMESIGKQFINDGRPHCHLVSPDTLTCLRLTVGAALQQMVSERQIECFDIRDATQPVHQNQTLEVAIRPTRSVELIVVDLVINP